MEFVVAERASIQALDSKLSAERASDLKHKLREALNLLNEYDKTGSEVLRELVLQKHQDVVDAIERRSQKTQSAGISYVAKQPLSKPRIA